MCPVSYTHDRAFVPFPDSDGALRGQTPNDQPSFTVARGEVSVPGIEAKGMNGSIMTTKDVSRHCWSVHGSSLCRGFMIEVGPEKDRDVLFSSIH